MLGVSAVVGYLMARLRLAAEREAQHAKIAEDLYALSQALREADNTNIGAKLLQEFIQRKSGHHVSVLLADSSFLIGNASAVDQQGLWACVQQCAALGPGSGRHENQLTIFLPIRSHSRASGAIAIHNKETKPSDTAQQQLLQQACDLLGLEIERTRNVQIAKQAEQDAQTQGLRNTLLTSISHDYRTPLANLIGAASSIQDQGDRLSGEKIQSLAKTIIEEADHLHRMTTNTLHLARLDAAPLQIKKDWESLHELIGSVLAKTRQRYPLRQIDVHIPDALPLVYCDAILLVQLFDNLLENAVKYSPNSSVIVIQVQTSDSAIELRIIDNGCGIPDAWKTKVFHAFERVHEHDSQADASVAHQLRRGVGVGLAVCHAITKVHDARIWVQDHRPQGTEMCVSFPLGTQPDLHKEDI
jgi:two-component system sensor histidine kinase KdpD